MRLVPWLVRPTLAMTEWSHLEVADMPEDIEVEVYFEYKDHTSPGLTRRATIVLGYVGSHRAPSPLAAADVVVVLKDNHLELLCGRLPSVYHAACKEFCARGRVWRFCATSC